MTMMGKISKYASILILLVFSFFTLSLFQNCAEPLNYPNELGKNSGSSTDDTDGTFVLSFQSLPLANYKVKKSESLQLNFSVNSDGPFSYSWEQNDSSNNYNLSRSSIFNFDAGDQLETKNYKITITDTKLDKQVNANFSIEVISDLGPDDVKIVTQPLSALTISGTNNTKNKQACISVRSSVDPVTYQWFKNGAVLAGEISNCIVFDEVTNSSFTGSYYVVADNGAGQPAQSQIVDVSIYPQAGGDSLVNTGAYHGTPHTVDQCVSVLGGTLKHSDISGEGFCKLSASTCPAGWKTYSEGGINYTTTTNTLVAWVYKAVAVGTAINPEDRPSDRRYTYNCGVLADKHYCNTNTGSHSFDNKAVESKSCSYSNINNNGWTAMFQKKSCSSTKKYKAQVTRVGCF